MTTRTIKLAPKDFFHARPSAMIADAARSYESVIMVMLGTEIADAKDSLSLMRLSHPNGSPVELMADGSDEASAIDGVLKAVENEFTIETA